MIYKISVPGLVADVDEIRVLEWHGAAPQLFETGALIIELETHKALVEVRAGQVGFLRKILVDAGEWQKIGAPLCIFSDTVDEAIPADAEALEDLLVEFEIT